MTITSIVSHGPVALETGPVCYGGAEEGTASKAWVYSEQVYEPTIRPKYCPTLSCEKEPAFSNFQDYSMGIMVPKVSASSKTDDALKTINAVNGSAENENQSARYRRNAVRGSANTNENLPISSLRSGLKIMYGERVGIQVLQHNTNQIKTREKPSPKTSDTAEAGALECYIRATSMLELMSAAGLNYRKPKFNSRAWRGPRQDSRSDRQLPVTTKASYDGAQIHLREKHAALLGSTILTNDKIQRDKSSSKEQPTTPPEQATLGATEIKCISRPAVVSDDSTSNDEYDRVLPRAIQDRRNELTHSTDTSDNKMLYARGGQCERERTLPTVAYMNGNMPTTGYNYSLQPNTKSVDQTALAELKEVGDLIVTSTQKELPVTGALLESNQYGNGNMEAGYISYTVPTLLIADSQRPKTRVCAWMDSLVIPDPCTDIPSMMGGTSGHHDTQGRPVWRGTSTAHIQEKYERALVKVMHHHRQQFILSTSQDGPLNVDDEGERVCTTPLADIESNKMAQGYYRNFLMGEEKASGEILRFFPNFDKTDTVVVEAKTACGERHELTRKAPPTTEVTTNVGPVQSTGTTRRPRSSTISPKIETRRSTAPKNTSRAPFRHPLRERRADLAHASWR